MMANVFLNSLYLFSVFSRSLAIGTNDQVNAPIDYGTFQNPSANVRPRFRYWVPDASVDLSTVASDIAAAGQAGAGGVELLGYYFYGEVPGDARYSPVLVDWTVYGWGSNAWKNLSDVALQSTKENKLIMDLAMGPNQGAGVPAPVDADSVQWNLLPFNVTVNGSYQGTLPGWGSGELVAAVSGLVTEIANSSAPEPSLPNDIITNRTQITLSEASLQDVTDQVGDSGEISFSVNSTSEGEEYLLFAFYLVHTEYREQETPEDLTQFSVQSPVTDYRENGSWVVDHFSKAGAEAVTGFWDSYLLGGSTKELISQVGNYVWEDSQEFGSAVYVFWTKQLVAHFQQYRGYSILKYLPLLFHNNNGFGGSQFATWYITDESDAGESHVADYRQSLLELNAVYLDTLREWANSLGVQLSVQVGYNLPADMEAQIPNVNAPECETLDFSSNIDAYRQFSGPANLAGKRVVSSECGANAGAAYRLTIPHLLWDVKRSIAGSVNNFVFHGYPYSGYYPNTTWPGFTTFDYSYSDMHGRRQPAWEYYPDFMDYVARTQYIAQSGVPKIDIAFWLKVTNWAAHQIFSEYPPTDLEDAGYSYEYVSPDDFALPEAFVGDGLLAPDRQGFKVLIVRSNQALTTEGVDKLYEYAQAGLPILFPGGMPSYFLGFNHTAAAEANQTMAKLEHFSNVHVVSNEGLAATLKSLGIQPRTSVTANSTWNTYWREDSKANKDYVYVYNDKVNDTIGQGNSTGSIMFETTGQPYTYDAWTGDVTPIYNYTRAGSGIEISLQLAGNQTTIIGFHHNEPTKTVKSGSITVDSWVSPSRNNKSAIMRSTSPPGSHSIQPISLINLTNWTLIVESWTAPSNLYDSGAEATRTNYTYSIDHVTSWRNTSDSLRNVSGRGFYSTTFTWPPSSSSYSSHSEGAAGALLDLGAIVHTARASINGQALPPLDVTNAVTDIGKYLKKGSNKVNIVVSTPLGNALRPIWDQVQTSGKTPPGARGSESIDAPLEADYGLVLPVYVRPYWEREVELVEA